MLKKLTATGVMAAAAVGVLLLGAPANADINTGGEGSVLGGNQVVIPIFMPINVCGNAIPILGGADAGCDGGAWVGHSPHHKQPYT